MKKVLILTVTAGNGHNACAKSIKRKIEQLDSIVDVKIVDVLKEYSSALNFWIADGGYNLAVSKLRPVYNYFYNVQKRSKPKKRYSCAAQGVAKSIMDGLFKEICSYQPDVIFCTHFYPAIALTNIKLAYNLPCKTVVTALDYVNSPFWEATIGVDYFNVANEDFIEESIEEGFRREQITTFGIPVDDRTLVATEKSKARAELGLENDVFTVMVMFGGGFWSGGFKIFKNIIDILGNRKAQVIMINGRNQKGYDKIQKMSFNDNLKVVNVGFTDKVPLYMSASDMIVNKCGGLSSTEVINQGLPMLATEKIPAQEIYNLEYLKSKGVAFSFKNKKQLADGLLTMMDKPEKREDMVKQYSSLRRNGAERLAQFILSFPEADYSQLLKENLDSKHVKKTIKYLMKKADKIERKKEN